MKPDLNLAAIVSAVQAVVASDRDFTALHEPIFSGNEWTYVKDCLDSGWVSSVGKYVDRFEADLAATVGVEHAVAVVNGTAALHICLLLAGVQPQEEVLVPALTFVATANAVSYCSATPHFIESEERTLGVDAQKLKDYLNDIALLSNGYCWNRLTGKRIAAIVPMHTFGHPVDLDPLVELSMEYRIPLIEDAAESLGSYYKGRHTGQFGQLSAFSFNGNKILTTGGGGAIVTNDLNLARAAKHLTTTAKVPHSWAYQHDQVGYNYRMPNINAALGCAQLEQLPPFLEKKRALAKKYAKALDGLGGIQFFSEPDFARSNYWLNTLVFDDANSLHLETFLRLTNDQGIMTRPAWTLMPDLPMFTECPKMDLSISRNLVLRMVNIPSSAYL